MGGLYRNNPTTKEGKYLVKRRDGTVPEWPFIVLGGRDPAAPAGLRAYADEAEKLGMDPQYVEDVRTLATTFETYRAEHGAGDVHGSPHRADDPATIADMAKGRGA